MKNTIIRAFAVFGLLAVVSLASSAYAQTISRTTFKVPFAFTAGNQTFPAGEYTVQFRVNDNPFLLRMSDADNHNATYLQAYEKSGRTPASAGKLIFRRYGNEYFLGEVWTTGQDRGLGLFKTAVERKLRKQISKGDHLAIAETSMAPELVSIVAIP